MITSASRIQDLEHVLLVHRLTMSATATGGLWTVVLDARPADSDPGTARHYVGSGGSLFEAISRALARLEPAQYTDFVMSGPPARGKK